MRKLLQFFIIVIIAVSCKKDKATNYSATIEVQDYYTEQPISGQTVIMEFCTTGLMWGHSCDSVMAKVTNDNGRATFHDSYEVEFGKGYEFYTLKQNGFMRSDDFRVMDEETQIIKIKPLVPLFLTIIPTYSFDSIQVYLGVYSKGDSDNRTFYTNDTLSMTLLATPEEENSLLIYGFKNGKLNSSKRKQGIFPQINRLDSLTVSIP